MKRVLISVFLAAAVTAAAQTPYKVIVPAEPQCEGMVAKLYNYDTQTLLDSVYVRDLAARFDGMIDESVLAFVKVGGKTMHTFVLEPGTVSFTKTGAPFGTMLNDEMREYDKRAQALRNDYGRYNALVDSMLEANSDNALGYYVFIKDGLGGKPVRLRTRALIKKYPDFAAGIRAKKMMGVKK